MLGGYSRKFSRRQCKIQLSRSQDSCRTHFQGFREPKIQNFGNHGATSGIYMVYLRYREVGTYDIASYGSIYKITIGN